MELTFKPHRNMLNKIIYYASNIERTIIKDPFGNTKFDRKIPEYIIIKEEKQFHCLKLKSWISDWMEQNGYITNVNNIYQEYTPIWTGCKTLKEAKEIIEEEYKKNLAE